MRGRDLFNKFKPIIHMLVKLCNVLPKGIRKKLFEHYRMTKGKKGLLIRYILLKTLGKSIGENVSIHSGVYMFNVEELSIGDNVSIHPMSYIEAKGGVTISSDISIAHGVTILSVNHIFSDPLLPIKDQGIVYKETKIESDVWIGAKASILAGVTVGKGSVIAAGAVITKDIEEYVVVAGIPGKIISKRKN